MRSSIDGLRFHLLSPHHGGGIKRENVGLESLGSCWVGQVSTVVLSVAVAVAVAVVLVVAAAAAARAAVRAAASAAAVARRSTCPCPIKSNEID